MQASLSLSLSTIWNFLFSLAPQTNVKKKKRGGEIPFFSLQALHDSVGADLFGHVIHEEKVEKDTGCRLMW